MSFPLHRVSQRIFDAGFAGEVFVCDIDRTYLATRFSTLKGLASIPIEFAIDKQAIEGMVALLREVRRGPGNRSRETPLYFISASPRQLRGVIERKMLLDGLEFDGTTFKDWGKVLLSLRPRRLREQLGFKVTALVAGRQELPPGCHEVLLGDDLEQDALAFALYADYLGGRLDESEVLAILRRAGVGRGDAEGIRRLRRLLPECAGVERGYVRLDRYNRNPERFLPYAPGIVACRGALQLAIALLAQGSVSTAGVTRVARELLGRAVGGAELDERLDDAVTRAIAPPAVVAEVRESLGREGLPVSRSTRDAPDPRWRAAMERSRSEPWTPRAERPPSRAAGGDATAEAAAGSRSRGLIAVRRGD